MHTLLSCRVASLPLPPRSAYTIDGCATFFKQERFHLVKKYEVEFNKAAISLADQMTNPQQKKATMNRLLKVGQATGVGTHMQAAAGGGACLAWLQDRDRTGRACRR